MKAQLVLLIDTFLKNSYSDVKAKIKKNSELIEYLNSNHPNLSLKEQAWLEYNSRSRSDFKCEHCGNEVAFRKWQVGYNRYCSIRCHAKRQIQDGTNGFINFAKYKALPILIKTCVTCGNEFRTKLDKRIACSKSCGCAHNHQIRTQEDKDKIQEKRERTSLKKYGNKHHIASTQIRDKIETKTGYRYAWQDPSVIENIQKSYRNKTGFHSPMKNPEVVDKMIATKIAKYGGMDTYNHYKEFTFPSGRMEKVQGYEPRALNDLLKTHDESDLVVGRSKISSYIGIVKYFDPVANRMRYYYPDIYIISERKIIEVKSSWTYDKQKNTNELKKQAILNKNLDFEFFIY